MTAKQRKAPEPPAPEFDPADDYDLEPTDVYPDDDDDPPPPPPVRTRREQKALAEAPAYLRPLLDLPGVGPESVAGVPFATAWVKIESDRESRSTPLAFLAPHALDTLAEWGFEGHTTFTVLERGPSGNVLCYFACMLEPLDDDEPADAPPGAPGDARLLEHIARQEAKLQQLAQVVQAQSSADPLESLDKSLALLARVMQVVNKFPGMGSPAAVQPRGMGDRIIDVAVQKVVEKFTGGMMPGAAEAPEEGAPADDN